MASMQITGVKELDRKLKSLERKMERKIARKAARKAAKPVLESAKFHVHKKSGALEASLKIRGLGKAKKGTVGARVVTGEKFLSGDQYYGGMQEYGTSFMSPNPFLRPAADENEQTVKGVFVREIAAELEKV